MDQLCVKGLVVVLGSDTPLHPFYLYSSVFIYLMCHYVKGIVQVFEVGLYCMCINFSGWRSAHLCVEKPGAVLTGS